VNKMPQGVFIRTLQYRENMAKAKKGRLFKSSEVLLDEVRQIFDGSISKLTPKQLHAALAAKNILPNNYNAYIRLWKQINNACKSGRLERNQIYDGSIATRLQPKFHIGDKVRIIRKQKRTPLWLRKELRLDTPRTIKSTTRTGNSKRYYLGSNGLGNDLVETHGFRATELELYTQKTTTGRPSTKRKYTRQCKDTSPANSELLIDSSVSPSISCVNCELVEVN